MEKVMQVNASFIYFVQIRHLAVWPLWYTSNPLVRVRVIVSEGNSTLNHRIQQPYNVKEPYSVIHPGMSGLSSQT